MRAACATGRAWLPEGAPLGIRGMLAGIGALIEVDEPGEHRSAQACRDGRSPSPASPFERRTLERLAGADVTDVVASGRSGCATRHEAAA